MASGTADAQMYGFRPGAATDRRATSPFGQTAGQRTTSAFVP